MKTFIIVFATLIIIAAIITSIYITLYTKLKFLKIKIEEAEKVINNEIENRFNLIEKCKITIEKNTKMDLTLFSDLENIKKSHISTSNLEHKINESVKTIYLIRTDYPNIDEKKEFKEIIIKLNESDTRIEAAKSFYNKNNSTLANLIKKFPANIIAKINKFNPQEYFDKAEVFNEADDGIKI